MTETDVTTPTPTESPMHRRRVGDTVVMNHDDHDSPDLNAGDEGTITGFANDEGTYILVDFGEDKGVHPLTEDEVTRVA